MLLAAPMAWNLQISSNRICSEFMTQVLHKQNYLQYGRSDAEDGEEGNIVLGHLECSRSSCSSRTTMYSYTEQGMHFVKDFMNQSGYSLWVLPNANRLSKVEGGNHNL